ncbi:hypothetical protein Y919_02775 [Caloranaerobacter azorensis H53214]|uniref:Uncharacterized protein n=1 Tax=Caloranaerobacter azorensis H53214 TaxID=1156417 RepID=A0A096BIV1_9FIRM|nr:hypothetical protein [Caloranaerobacter azorensis]KGG81095.1 hypothetical protein Y919_02775 [Caloranaerobacter azorensis H53214]
MPILKWKKGEQEALKNLSESQKSAIIPLIEIVDYNEPEVIFECLNSCFSNPVYIDTSIAAQDDRDYLALIARIFKDNSKKIFPVLYYDDFPYFAKSITEVSEQIAIRVPLPEDIDGPSYSEIFKVIKDFKSNNDTLIDVILDLNVIAKKHEANSQLRELKYVLEQFFLDSKSTKNKKYSIIIIN